MGKKVFISILLLLGALHGFGAAYNDLWQKGNALYQQKQYDSAAYYYEQIAALKPQNAVVYYNLGNTYYRLNNIPYAVLNYERALHIDPQYKEARENLALTKSRITNRIQSSGNIFFISWWHAATRGDKAANWAIISVLTFIAIIACLLVRRLRTDVRLPSQVVGILSFVLVIFLVLSFAATQRKINDEHAVVMQNDAPLMNDDLKGKPLSLIPAGTTVEVTDERGGWTQVRLPDGRRGWLQEVDITKI